jgi:hypothetical protein
MGTSSSIWKVGATGLDAARDEALEAARGPLADAIKAGSYLDVAAVIVMDDQRQELDRVFFTAVLPKGFQRRPGRQKLQKVFS